RARGAIVSKELPVSGMKPRTRIAAIAALATVATLILALAMVPASAAAVRQAAGTLQKAAPTAAPAHANWPMFHGNPGVTGVSQDPAISAANASQLGVRWMTHTFGPVLSSPVTSYRRALNTTLAYVANETGHLEAINTANGAIVWSDSFGVPIHAT